MNLHFQLQNQKQYSLPAQRSAVDANECSSVTLVTPSHITRGLTREFHVAEESILTNVKESRHDTDSQDRKRQRESSEGKDDAEIVTKKAKNVTAENVIYQ